MKKSISKQVYLFLSRSLPRSHYFQSQTLVCPLLSLPGPCSWDHAPQGCWLLLLWRLSGQRQPRLHLSSSVLQLLGLSWWGRNKAYSLGWEQSSLIRFKSGPRQGVRRHSAHCTHCTSTVSWTHGLPYARDTGHDKLCTTSAVTLILPWCARLGRDTLYCSSAASSSSMFSIHTIAW